MVHFFCGTPHYVGSNFSFTDFVVIILSKLVFISDLNLIVSDLNLIISDLNLNTNSKLKCLCYFILFYCSSCIRTMQESCIDHCEYMYMYTPHLTFVALNQSRKSNLILYRRVIITIVNGTGSMHR